VTGLDVAIARSSLREEAVRRIRSAIIYGDIEPGRIHSAPALAARMGVSITPVREALLELTNRGLVEQVRNRGFRVVERTPEDLDATIELRALVEAPMVRRVAGRLDDRALAGLRELVDAGERAAQRGQLSEFLDLARRFHVELLQLAGNPRVVAVVEDVLDHLRLASFGSRGGDALEDVIAGHHRIVDAIAVGDGAAAERAVHEHLELTRAAWAAQPARP
jgi:DNA-binding GntR family transcriptional regulator